MSDPVRILYRPVGPKELALIAESGFREFPPRLPEQPIFYPVTNEEYWIPAEELPELNRNIVGLIEVIESFEQT
jgi:hypothetical protein